jgi:superfamily II DNA/RNA helicase
MHDTGSGKTLGFLLPILIKLRALHNQHERDVKAGTSAGDSEVTGPLAVIVSPTRELAAQTARCLALLAKGMKLKCSLLTPSAAAGMDHHKVA